MNKTTLILILCLSLGLSPLCAVESAQNKSVQNTALSSADKEFLFNTQANKENLNVEALSNEEMQNTQGEFWEIAGVLIAGGNWLYDVGHNNGWWK